MLQKCIYSSSYEVIVAALYWGFRSSGLWSGVTG